MFGSVNPMINSSDEKIKYALLPARSSFRDKRPNVMKTVRK